jgi:hypothetical protein
MKTALAGLLAALALACTAANPAPAQEAAYPSRPVKILVAFPVGGLLDTVARVVGDKLSALLGQQFIIESRPGAGGTLATAAVARAEPDGYTLMMINDNHAVNPSVFKNIPYDSLKDFAPIGFVGSAPMVLTANAQIPVRTVKDLVELARQKPGTISYGSVGPGSASHLAGELFAAKAGINMLHVPFRGGAPALNDLVAGHVNTMFLTAVVGMQQMEGRHTDAARDRGPGTLRDATGGADHGRSRLRAGGGLLVRPGSARGHAADDPREAGKGAGRGPRHARPAQAADGNGSGGDATRVEGIRRLHPGRDAQMVGCHRPEQDHVSAIVLSRARSRSGLLTAGIPLGVKWPDSRAVRRTRHSAARAWLASRRRATPEHAAIGASGYAGHDPEDRGGLGGSSAA